MHHHLVRSYISLLPQAPPPQTITTNHQRSRLLWLSSSFSFSGLAAAAAAAAVDCTDPLLPLAEQWATRMCVPVCLCFHWKEKHIEEEEEGLLTAFYSQEYSTSSFSQTRAAHCVLVCVHCNAFRQCCFDWLRERERARQMVIDYSKTVFFLSSTFFFFFSSSSTFHSNKQTQALKHTHMPSSSVVDFNINIIIISDVVVVVVVIIGFCMCVCVCVCFDLLNYQLIKK